MQRAARPPHPSITYSTQSVDSRVKIVARCQQASSIFSQPVLGRCACGFRTAAQCAMRAEPHVSDKYPLPLEQNPMLGGQDSFSYKSRRSNEEAFHSVGCMILPSQHLQIHRSLGQNRAHGR